MSAFPRTPYVLGFAALLAAGTSAFAIDAAQAPQAAPQVAAATQQGADAAPQPAAQPIAPHTQQAVALVSNGVAAKAATDPNCPTVTLAPDGETRRSDGTTATLDGLARDCANLGAETILKVALVGESERKESAAAAIDAPMTIQIRDGQGRDVETRRINLKVEMPEGVQRVAFRHVEENVSLPPPSADGYANWTIVVGLDPSAEADDQVAAADEQAEPPARSVRSAKSRKSRYSRSRATRRARDVAARQQPAPAAVDPNAVVVSAKPQAAGGAQVTMTTTNSGSAMTRAAEYSRSTRDKAAYDKQVQALQQDRARRGLPPVPASAIRRQGAPAQQQAARQQASRQQASGRQVQTAQTN